MRRGGLWDGGVGLCGGSWDSWELDSWGGVGTYFPSTDRWLEIVGFTLWVWFDGWMDGGVRVTLPPFEMTNCPPQFIIEVIDGMAAPIRIAIPPPSATPVRIIQTPPYHLTL